METIGTHRDAIGSEGMSSPQTSEYTIEYGKFYRWCFAPMWVVILLLSFLVDSDLWLLLIMFVCWEGLQSSLGKNKGIKLCDTRMIHSTYDANQEILWGNVESVSIIRYSYAPGGSISIKQKNWQDSALQENVAYIDQAVEQLKKRLPQDVPFSCHKFPLPNHHPLWGFLYFAFFITVLEILMQIF